jgi:hypothetical protein
MAPSCSVTAAKARAVGHDQRKTPLLGLAHRRMGPLRNSAIPRQVGPRSA